MKKPYLFAGISILFWSTLATVSKLLLGSLSSYQVLLYSALFAALTLLLVNLITGKIKLLCRYRPRDYLIMLLIGLPGTFFYYVFLYLGTARMEASQAFIINYLWPIMSVLFAALLLKERLTPRKLVAFALSFLGVLTVAGGQLLQFNETLLIGTVLCVLAAVSYGLFTALTQKWQYDEQVSMMLSFFAAFLLSIITNAWLGQSTAPGGLQWLGFAYNGIFIMALATVTWALALKTGGTAKISNLAYITPFLSLVWTFFVLHEPIAPLSLVGLAVIVLGLFIQLGGKEKPAQIE